MFPTINAQIPGGLDSRTQPTVVLSSVSHLQALDQKDPPFPVHNMLIAAALWQFLISFEPAYVSIRFGDLADQLDTVCFCCLHVGQVLGEPGLLLCDERFKGEAKPQKKSGLRQLRPLPMTVSMPEDLEVLASHSYSASSSNTDLWMMRTCWRPWAMISYFFPFLISLPSRNQRTCGRRHDVGGRLQRPVNHKGAHLHVLPGELTFEPGSLLLSDLNIMERFGELNAWSCT